MRYGYTALLSFALLTCSLPVRGQGQNTSFQWKFEEASKLMEEKFYNQAADIWTELVTAQPENSNLNWKLGHSYMNSYNQKAKALPYLKTASEKRTQGHGGFNASGYDPFDPAEVNAPVEVDYWLGRAYHLNGEFDKADASYDKFLAEVDGKHDLVNQAKRGKEQTANARVLGADRKSYVVSNVGAVINTELPDFSPVISVDGNAMFFTSRRVRTDSSNSGVLDETVGMPFEDIFVSYKDRSGNWQAPELLNISGPGHEATVNVSADGQTLFIYRSDDGDGNLYESKLVGELWSDPVLIGSDVNSKSWEPHCAMSADGSTLYFVSDRKGGQGGRDLYRVVKLPNGEWSKSQNLGTVLNTPFDEDAVFIHPNGRTMYFSSTGHNSMGGFDIFYTELGEDGVWSKPVNLGVPINTVDDDAFFVTTADGRRGYFSSDQVGGYGEKDIYFVDLPEDMEADGLTVLKGFIVPAPGETLPPSTILYVTDKATGDVKAYKPRQRDGVYVAILPPCKNYNLDYRVNDVTVHTEDIFVECESSYQEINKEIYLNPISLGGPASALNLPPGSPPGSKEKGDAVAPLTDAQLKDKASKHVAPDATYDGEYAKYYAYNMKDIDQNEIDWKTFVDVVVGLIDKNGQARVVVEASASKVPTKTFGTNENLSNQRMEDARNRLLEAVAARGKDNTKLLLEAVNSKVQGPKYDGDFRNTDKYGKFQFVMLKVH